LLQGKLLVARPRCRDREILKDAAAVEDIFFQAEMIEIDARRSGRKTQVSWRRLY
jgi:hypothetical protein